MPCSSQTLGDDTFAGSGLPLLSSFGEEICRVMGKGSIAEAKQSVQSGSAFVLEGFIA